MNLPEGLIFSQSSLQDYVDCPRRFQLKYLERLRWPAIQADPVQDHEKSMRQGADFHQLIHQHLLGIPAEILAKQIRDDVIRKWWDVYLLNGLDGLPETRRPEMTLSVPLGDGYRLMAKYDLLAIEQGKRAVIVDWKTSKKVPRREWLAKRLQTIVYRYVLVGAGAYLNGGKALKPSQIEMRYWYAANDGQQMMIRYDDAQYRQDEAYLLQLVDEINRLAEFPLTLNERSCAFCVYRSLCDRGLAAGALDDLLEDVETDDFDAFDIDFEQVAEIEF